MNDERIKRIGERVRIDLLARGESYTFEDVARLAISALTPADLVVLVAEKLPGVEVGPGRGVSCDDGRGRI